MGDQFILQFMVHQNFIFILLLLIEIGIILLTYFEIDFHKENINHSFFSETTN